MKKKWYIVIGLCLGPVIFLIHGLQDLPDGQAIISREKCMDCHSFKGRGGAIGPDLTAVTSRRNEGWIRDQIRHPEKHNPDSRMPSFGHLSWREISEIIKYLKK